MCVTERQKDGGRWRKTETDIKRKLEAGRHREKEIETERDNERQELS